MNTLAILTSGGSTCALNASVLSIRDSSYEAGYKKIYSIRRGYQGLLDGWVVAWDHSPTEHSRPGDHHAHDDLGAAGGDDNCGGAGAASGAHRPG